MISLAGRDILHAWGKFIFTGIGLGLLIGVTLTMAGVYRGMVDDGKVLLDNSGANLWVVQRDTLGPYAHPFQGVSRPALITRAVATCERARLPSTNPLGALGLGARLLVASCLGLRRAASSNKRSMSWHGCKLPTCGRCSGGNAKAIAS